LRRSVKRRDPRVALRLAGQPFRRAICPHVAPLAYRSYRYVAMKEPVQTMNQMQTWIEELNPLASLPSIAILFLIAIIAGWYVGNLIQWLRR
jgi:hypothetical protein